MTENPYRKGPTFNLTAQMWLERNEPDMARRLKDEALADPFGFLSVTEDDLALRRFALEEAMILNTYLSRGPEDVAHAAKVFYDFLCDGTDPMLVVNTSAGSPSSSDQPADQASAPVSEQAGEPTSEPASESDVLGPLTVSTASADIVELSAAVDGAAQNGAANG